jgi:hypothetical protein
MKPIEIAFFAVAFLLPLVGGGALLYFLSRGAKGKRDDKE